MAKKVNPLFSKTEGDLDAGNIRPTGVGLREGEIGALDLIGVQMGLFLDSEPVARNTLMRIAIRRMIEAYQSGELTREELAKYFETPDKPQPKLKF